MSKDDKERRCNFCGRTETEVDKLVAGPNVFICNECIDVCQHIVNEDKVEELPDTFDLQDIPTPKEIKAHLDQYVIGQDDAKISLHSQLLSN